MHNNSDNSGYRIRDYRQALRKYSAVLEKYDIYVDFDNEMLEYLTQD